MEMRRSKIDPLLDKLREAAQRKPRGGWLGVFTPEQVARGLEAMRRVTATCGSVDCISCWERRFDAFISAAGREGREATR